MTVVYYLEIKIVRSKSFLNLLWRTHENILKNSKPRNGIIKRFLHRVPDRNSKDRIFYRFSHSTDYLVIVVLDGLNCFSENFENSRFLLDCRQDTKCEHTIYWAHLSENEYQYK